MKIKKFFNGFFILSSPYKRTALAPVQCRAFYMNVFSRQKPVLPAGTANTANVNPFLLNKSMKIWIC